MQNDAARCEDGLGQAWGHAAPVAEKSGDPGERTLQAADELAARRSGQIVPRRNQQVSHPLDREHEEDSSSWHQRVLRGGQQYEQRRRTQDGESAAQAPAARSATPATTWSAANGYATKQTASARCRRLAWAWAHAIARTSRAAAAASDGGITGGQFLTAVTRPNRTTSGARAPKPMADEPEALIAVGICL